MKTILTTIASIFICTLLIAQDCDCSLSEVENNTVTPCEYTIGTVVTVSTTTEFNAAVQQANSRGNSVITIEIMMTLFLNCTLQK